MSAPPHSTKEPHDLWKTLVLVKPGDPNAPNILDQLDTYAFARDSIGSNAEPPKQASDGQNGLPTRSQSGSARKPGNGELPQLSRVAKVETPAEPESFQQWRDSIAENFPTLASPAEVCASVIAQTLINDVSNPFALALVDVPSSGKTITLNFFSDVEELVYTTDTFTAASFVSNSSNVARPQLAQIDLLPRIRYRTLIVRELASLFNAKEDELKKTIGTLTRVLDGEGYETDTGVHGRRGYKGDYLFMMLAATTPIPPRLFKLMGNIGSRLFFLSLHSPRKKVDDLIAQSRSKDRKSKENSCRASTSRFLRTLWAKHPNGVEWDKDADPGDCLRVIANCAQLLANLRGAINVWTVGEDGENLTHSVPTIEHPDRINTLLYNLARGHALICGREQIAREDLWPVIELAFDSAPSHRAKVFRLLIENGGELTTNDVVKALRCSAPTARKEMEALHILEVVDKAEGMGQSETHIWLAETFGWFASDECRQLIGTAHSGNIC